MDIEKLFKEWIASKPDEKISYGAAFQLLDFVAYVKKAVEQSEQADPPSALRPRSSTGTITNPMPENVSVDSAAGNANRWARAAQRESE